MPSTYSSSTRLTAFHCYVYVICANGKMNTFAGFEIPICSPYTCFTALMLACRLEIDWILPNVNYLAEN